ncbi:HMP-PP phosphatase [Candidatus Lokiarchaeum ossiferum]|uniref:HMP-PP phosphatase n=1 Tax=Candidatus Lokiarchaeum ossiferum TaxID=2951803 RepID=A0ABY6HV17_9ARCH|nr:HMP-PP phosphatase [Candidatus Lokiarchaeum sp. B-35]
MSNLLQNQPITQNSTLYISDLDGTLMDDEQKIASTSIDIINQFIAQGNLFSIATARSFESAYPKIKDLNLNIPIICHNGIFIYDPVQESILKSSFLREELVEKLLAIYYQLNLNPILYAINEENQNKVYFTSVNNASEKFYIEDRIKNKDPRFIKVSKLPEINDKTIEINIILPDNQVEFVRNQILEDPEIYIHEMKDIYSPGFTWIEVVPRDGNKKDALIFLKKFLQVKKIVCFGDNTNDIPMFEVADEGCAVENAVIELKKIATRTIGNHKENGVALYLQKMMG